MLDVLYHVLGVLQGADHNGYICLLGDFEYTGAEVVELAVLGQDAALGEDRDGCLILIQDLDASRSFSRLISWHRILCIMGPMTNMVLFSRLEMKAS